MEGNKNSNHFSSADIQKYLEGKLSAAEMHAIEKAALDDPFLADAIEGMQKNLQERSSGSFNSDVNELNERLQNRIKKKDKIISFAPNHLWQRVAAVVIILIGSTALIYNYVIKNSENHKAIAIRKENAIADSDNVKNNISASPPKKDSAVANDVAIIEKKKEKNLSENKPKQNPVKQKSTNKNLKVQEKNIAAPKQAEPDKTKDADIVKNDIAERKAVITIKTDTLKTDSLKNITAANAQPVKVLQGKASGLNVQRANQFKNNFVQGKVVDNDKNPVVGATVMLKNKKNGTSTDANGFFKLNANNKDSITNVVVNSVGFQSANALLNNNASSNVIQLQPSNQSLNEVVVVGYGTEKKDDADDEKTDDNNKEKVISSKAEPAVGWIAFNDYVNQNKKIATSDSTKKGKEIISFIVDTTNQLSSFKIKKSLSKSHDAEAIRLIKQGPAWKLLKRKKAKVTLAIQF